MNQAPQPETRKFLGPGVFMLAGLALFLACAAARFSWSRGEDWKVLLMVHTGMVILSRNIPRLQLQ